MNNKITLVILFLSVFLHGCASNNNDEERASRGATAKELYESGMSAIKTRNYRSAIQKLRLLDNRYPFGDYTQPGQLSLIFAYYKSGDSASALATADRFIRQNPQHARVDYAYYMKGLINFSEESNLLSTALSAPPEKRDSSAARQAFEDFADLIKKFPESQYVKDAQQRMIYLRNRLANYELHVAQYYMSRDAYHAALNRAKYVVEHFPKTPATPKALNIMMIVYDVLGLKELSENTRRILVLNYPDFNY